MVNFSPDIFENFTPHSSNPNVKRDHVTRSIRGRAGNQSSRQGTFGLMGDCKKGEKKEGIKFSPPSAK
jgi:hypothetical protein